jgi:lipoate-protein ligase A
MILRDISLLTPQENILCDEVLLYLAEHDQGGEALRFWESERLFIVLGRISNAREDIHAEAVLKDDIPVVRRASGGGTVLQGKGCLNYSLVLSKEAHPSLADLKDSYQFILHKIILALDRLGVKAVFYLPSDLALAKNNKKISGNAQKRGRKFILHHGTLLYNFDIPLMEMYLAMPENIPGYRQNRSHRDFTANIPVPVERIKDEIKNAFGAKTENNALSAQEMKCLSEFSVSRPATVDSAHILCRREL